MNTIEVYYKIKSLFVEVDKCSCIEALANFIERSGFSKQVRDFYLKYPSFDFRITANDINNLRNAGIITESNTLNPKNFPQDPLAKLLAAVLWKNGDIKKVQHLIDGIMGTSENRSEYPLIFKQYGASLANNTEPIVDQHVLRAFELYCLESYSEEAVEKIRRKSLFKTVDKPHLDKYRNWFRQLISNVPLSERARYCDMIDKIIFIHGKEVKN
jgi:hypothetical protein